ncbi:hypothetical protein G5714_024693 [Onychostoma macrolepis]|uniref:Uncharacterized protein n=1 Tax=Onychostoma macrolepis TaxID=369639 RepID=A0A7J6BIH3_9TELE|nr:hypothetical protein G5714_024693 [Onychostoma macrolepis]
MDIMIIFVATIPVISDGLIVHGPSGPLVALLGSSVVLPCYVDKLLLMEDLEVEWRGTDSETLVHLYQDGESRAESQQQDYHDRAHFFTDQIQHGNFSLHLDNLTAEDKSSDSRQHREARTNDFPVTGFNQNQDSQNAAESYESPASGSNQSQKTAESFEMNPLLKPEETPPDSVESQT